MSSIKSLFYTILINILGILAVVGATVVIPISGYYIYIVVIRPIADQDNRGTLPNYTSYPWANKHFEEYSVLDTEYHDFIVWRRLPFSGETITIDSYGIRKTLVDPNLAEITSKYLLFGGSAMWGTGVTDDFTIPSILSKRYGVDAVNYGETGYTARQSMAMLANLYALGKIKKTNNTIIFYDGVNDVSARCRSEITGVATAREKQIQSRLQGNALSWIHIMRPAIEFIGKVKRKIAHITDSDQNLLFDCAKNKERAIEVAKSLVETWRMSSAIASANGDRFVAVLQPVAHFGSANIDHLPGLSSSFEQELKRQYQDVYPLIIQYASETPGLRFLDFSHAYDSQKQVYIDFAHVSPQGHILLLDEIDKHKETFNL